MRLKMILPSFNHHFCLSVLAAGNPGVIDCSIISISSSSPSSNCPVVSRLSPTLDLR